MIMFFIFMPTSICKFKITMTYKRMYYLVSIDKGKEYYKTYYQHNKYRHKRRYIKQKLKIKEDAASVEK